MAKCYMGLLVIVGLFSLLSQASARKLLSSTSQDANMLKIEHAPAGSAFNKDKKCLIGGMAGIGGFAGVGGGLGGIGGGIGKFGGLGGLGGLGGGIAKGGAIGGGIGGGIAKGGGIGGGIVP